MMTTLIIGCQPARRPVPYTNEEGVAEQNINVNDLNTRAERLKGEIDKFPEADNSYVVVTDGTALIGIVMKQKNTKVINRGLREDIERKVQGMDNLIDRVYVTADSGLTERIRRVAENISQGQPLTGMADEMQNLLRDMRESM